MTEGANMFYKDIQKTETLQIIRYLESNNGKFLNHKSSAKGEYGIMPKFLDDAKKHFKYNKIILNENQKASIGYDFVVKKIGTDDPYHVAYAWINGVYKLKPLPYRRPEVLSHWYVKRFKNKYKEIDYFSFNLLFSFLYGEKS
jgi:hypothetical protein